jgi:transposase-like protein
LVQIARELGVSSTGLQRWVSRARVDSGERPGTTTDDHQELVRLRRDVRRLEMENEILKRAAAYFAKENVLPKQLSD